MYKCAYEECSQTVWPTKYNYDKLAKCYNNDDGEIIEVVIAGNEYLTVESYRSRFTHAPLVNNPNHDKGHGNLCRMSFYASIY